MGNLRSELLKNLPVDAVDRGLEELGEFEEFCGELTLEDGSRMVLEPFQKRMLADYFCGVTETLILIPKKNGKSSLLAAVALFHLLTTPDADCVIGAASRDQATILWKQAKGYISRAPWLQKLCKAQKGYRHIHSLVDEGTIRVLAADADTADGVIPTLALVDELHRHKNNDLYAVFRDGLTPRNGRIVTISTAGDDKASALGKLREKAYAFPGMTVEGKYRRVRTSAFCMHEWALDDVDDRDDLELVKQANPASWQTIEALRIRHDSPSMMPWEWARFACGVWMYGEDTAVSETEWRACEERGVRIPDGVEVVIGADFGWKWDTTAFVPVWRRPDGKIVAETPVVIVPPRDNTVVDFDLWWRAIEELHRRFPSAEWVLDPNKHGEIMGQRIEKELNGSVTHHTQAASVMSLAAQRFVTAIRNRLFVHPGDEVFSLHVLSAVPLQVRGSDSFRLVKGKHGHPIDACIAAAMAVSVLQGDEEFRSVYESRGAILL